MNDLKYRYILYAIVIVTLSTIVVQGYWNYKNYLSSKQQLINDIQSSLDKAVDDYYAELAHKTTLGFKIEGNSQKDVFKDGGFFDKLSKSIDESNKRFNSIEDLEIDSIKGIKIFRGLKADSLMENEKKNRKILSGNEIVHQLKFPKKNYDSINFENIGLLTSKVFISIKNDSLDIQVIDSLLNNDLARKNIKLDYYLDFIEAKKKLPSTLKNKTQKEKIGTTNLLSTKSLSTFLPKNSSLTIYFENINWTIFNRIFTPLFISTLLVLAVISCLFYLLKIIKNQKQLAEVKNDLISNITHEFKTPIATIGVALESIKNFNIIDDKEKTKTYIDISDSQLSNLNVMVEKLLETATLDSDSLNLNKEEFDISELIQTLVNKHKLQTKNKTINLVLPKESILAKVDVFHFENAVNNILDNAIKYGGNTINVNLSVKSSSFIVTISDNGNSLKEDNKNKIFEKFYRIPKGNTHDVKGFGIGLYYTKTIIEKHNGSVILDLNNKLTTFKISLPNG